MKAVPFRPEGAIPRIKPGQNSVVFVPVLTSGRSGNFGQIPAGTPRFGSGRSVLSSSKQRRFMSLTKYTEETTPVHNSQINFIS